VNGNYFENASVKKSIFSLLWKWADCSQQKLRQAVCSL